MRSVTCALLAAVALTGCSGAGAVAPSSGTLPQASSSSVTRPLGAQTVSNGGQVFRYGDASRPSAQRGWLSAAAKGGGPVLYGSSYDGGHINIYSQKGTNQAPIGQLTSGLLSPQGMVVDRHHQLWVANTNAFTVVAFKRGSTTPFTTLNDPNYYPLSVAVDSNGTVYAANAQGTTGQPGNVTVWTKGSTNPTGTLTYPTFEIVLGVGVDASNNVYVSYIPTSGPPTMLEFPAGSGTPVPVSILSATGDMTFDKAGDLVMETNQNALGVWTPPYAGGATRTIQAFGNEPTLSKNDKKVWIAYANFSTPKIEGYDYTSGKLVDTITNGWTASEIPYGVALDPAQRI